MNPILTVNLIYLTNIFVFIKINITEIALINDGKLTVRIYSLKL